MDIYRAVQWGPSVGVGVNNAILVALSAIGKSNSATDPYVVANELVAMDLGRFLRLPVPPGCAILDATGDPYFASLDFNLTGNALPPIRPDRFIQAYGNQAVADVIVFDVLIGNSDRHAGNLSADFDPQVPRYNVFDHSHSLFGGSHHGPIGIPRLESLERELVIDPSHLSTGPAAAHGGNVHCFCDQIDDDAPFDPMFRRVEAIPDFFIDDVVEATRDYGVGDAEAARAKAFLRYRRDNIRSIIAGHKPAFTAILQWSLL